ncbi:CocE/NonD family hydrolase [Streptacidiphilus jiangxiensis]|uniref:Putative hydrolase, CocE/NonD family n=1 Tax=Streptacidiphilus jiangxiensis TaxID=235985 RepID=A0A1H7QY88_STRJI|nr:CocE/NonD family hydrolase [Streptacidiphilus jiangxiensis]SEL52277.1 putative hydrolase, CocE/NonD family [Streptacidiphilus jiangxiensis]
MTAAGGEPIPSITDATLTDIATNGIWGPGPTVNQAAVDTARALLAVLQGETGVTLPAELSKLVADVRQRASIGLPRIVAHDGVRLSAFSIKLNASDPRPAVIVPAGWSPYGWLPFMYAYLTLALRGYHVLAYTPRGLGDPALPSTSEGFIDVAGPHDWADGSTVLDYATEMFEPTAIGLLGESYGSGISQLVAAHDPANRVQAVVALSTWGNLATSLYDNGTRHLEAVKALTAFTGGDRDDLADKFDDATRQILADFAKGENLDEVVAWGTERSPEAYADLTNARGIPTFFSGTWHESLFPPGQLIDTFAKLTVPKRLNMWIGDHGAPEGPGLAGLLTGLPFPGLLTPMREAYDWLDQHLLGKAVPEREPVSNQVMFTYRTAPVPGGGNRITTPARREQQPDWYGGSSERWYPTATGADGDGALSTEPTSGWARDFFAGELTEATAMDAILQTGQKEWFGNPKTYEAAKFDRTKLLVWSTDPLTGPDGVARRIRGAATLQLTVRSTKNATTLVAYLFDLAPDGTARIVTHEPCTVSDLDPGKDRTVNWRLQPTAYDLPDGHRLALVVNSCDKLYSTASKDSTTTVTAPTDNAATLDLPLL